MAGPVRLRRFTSADIDRVVDLDSEPEVIRYLFRTSTPRSVVAREILPRILTDYDRSPGYGQWAAEEVVGGDFLGWFSLHAATLEAVRRPELGYRLRRACWGRGIASAVVPQLLDWAFTRLEVDAVWAETMAVNARSRRLLERSGLRHLRTDHVEFADPLPGTEAGEAVYELTRDEWRTEVLRRGPRPG